MAIVIPRPMIPKHWAIDLPLMLGHLKRAAGGHLLRTDSAHLARACGCWCDDVPVSVTFSGATGCLGTFMNATFAITPSVVEDACGGQYFVANSLPGSPCSDPLTCYETPPLGQVWFPHQVQATVGYKRTDHGIVASIAVLSTGYFWDGVTCIGPGLSGTCGISFYRPHCTSGTFTVFTSFNNQPTMGTFPTACSVAF